VGRFVSLHLGELGSSGPPPEPGERDIVDRWVLSHLADAIDEATAAFEAHDYAQAYQAASRMFWSIYCDRYIEMIKDRADRASVRWTLLDSFRALLGLFAPFAPFLTENLYQRFYREHEDAVSLHLTRWPVADPRWRSDRSAVDQLAVILDATRVLRSGLRLGNSARLSQLVLDPHDEAAEALLDQIAEPLRIAARADAVVRGPAEHPSGVDGITVGIVP
jgi:valyl-tRNA synthetase